MVKQKLLYYSTYEYIYINLIFIWLQYGCILLQFAAILWSLGILIYLYSNDIYYIIV